MTSRWDQLITYVEKIQDSALKDAILRFLYIYRDQIETWPASLRHHCNYPGGLLEHTIHVVELALKIADLIGYKRRDEVIASAVLHDIGKVLDYVENLDDPVGFSDNPDKWGPHEVTGIQWFQNVTGYVLPLRVARAILGHMGGWSRSSVYPEDLLGAILHAADLLASRLEEARKKEGG